MALGLVCGGFFIQNKEKNILGADAVTPTYGFISNTLPAEGYFNITPSSEESDAVGYVGNEAFLLQPTSTIAISVADNTISGTTEETEDSSNAGFIPNNSNLQEYYYFDFTSLALYYNLTNTQIEQGQSSTNLLTNEQLSNFVSSNDGSSVNDLNFTPEKLNTTFQLNTALSNVSVTNSTITLNNEGIYTYSVRFNLYHTTNGGITFVSSAVTVNYTFMVFNANRYFNSVGLQLIEIDDNMQESQIPASESYSRYYFYNYSHYNSENQLPRITYNPNIYRISISYTDINQNSFSSTLDYSDGQITQYDANGNVIDASDYFVYPVLNSSDVLNLYFTDLGVYDINFEYLYVSLVDGVQTTYRLPFESLQGNANLQNKNQRLYIYGYQATFSDYANLDPLTGQPQNTELKKSTIDKDGGRYSQNADITSSVNAYMGESSTGSSKPHNNMASPSSSSQYTTGFNKGDDGTITPKTNSLERFALDYINGKEKADEELDSRAPIIPISTNQTPISFLNNVNLCSNGSWVYEVNGEAGAYTLANPTKFQGFNQNSAGKYLYVIQYQYDYYMSTSGTLQKSYYHYQIFFFEVTNITPTITVLDEGFNEIYNNGYTNQSVYVLNDAQNNVYDAPITITLSAYDYSTKTYFFQDVNVENLDAYGMSYGQFGETEKEAIRGKYGFIISNQSRYANATFTVTINTLNSSSPGTKIFTIDTNEITGITTRNVRSGTGNQYSILADFNKYNTNQPFIFSWDPKDSGATTYGYIKRIDLESINYYSSLTSSNLSSLLFSLLNVNMLPVSYKLNLSTSTAWREYQNSNSYQNVIDATYVLSASGLYILEVYDRAGNSQFYLTLLDDTEPVFVQRSISNTTSLQLINNSQTISIPEDDTQISIHWADRKAIYIENISNYSSIEPYSATIGFDQAENNLQTTLESFFSSANQEILNLTTINTATNEDTGISSYNGSYLTIDINDTAYIRSPIVEGESGLSPYVGNEYTLEFIDENDDPIEGTYIFSIIDQSNTQITGNEQVDYTNYPSSFITFNVTSDAARLLIAYINNNTRTELVSANFDLTGNLYQADDGSYTHLPATGDSENEETTLSYKFAYFTPINAQYPVQISYIPFAENGSILDSLTLEYYPYIRKSQENTIPTGEYILDRNNPTPQTQTVTEYYYDIASEPSRTLVLYQYDPNISYDSGYTLTFDLALGQLQTPLAGRYVITRQYRTENQSGETGENAYSAYDYFRRILTFDVDDFGIISPTETITSGENSSLESVVGGDIFVNMYSGAGNTSIQVSFPTYTNGLNSGSFYTNNSFTEGSDVSYSVSGDKLPMTLYIPGFKYTQYNSVSYNDNNTPTSYVDGTFINTSDDTLDYTSIINNNTSFYGNATIRQEGSLWYVYIEGLRIESGFASEAEAYQYLINNVSIAEYKLKANITFTKPNNPNRADRYFTTNGTLLNGYLQFFEADNDFNIINSTPIANFYQEGYYSVTLYQASDFGNLNNFYDLYKFGFEIISQQPDFQIIGSNGYQLQERDSNIYYTNSNQLTIQWEEPTSMYKARIDENAIRITASQGSYQISSGDISSSGANGLVRSFTLDTSGLASGQLANQYLTITMQYEGYNSNYYRQVSKTIYFDISAPTANLDNLMANTENATGGTFTSNFQKLSMRRYFDNEHQENSISSVEDVANMSYCYSANTGYFEYFSYNVTKDFFYTILRDTVANAHLNNYNTQYVYFRNVESLDSYTQVDRDSFSQSPYTLLLNDNSQSLNLRCGYYEIVEMDYAGNMCVYLVYLIDTDTVPPENDSNVSTLALAYTNSSHGTPFEIFNEDITSGTNIYSNSGFSLTSYNYMSDPWGMFNVQLAGQSIARYMKSPWLENGYVYRLTINASGYTLEPVQLSSIFESVQSSNNKHSLSLANRINGQLVSVYLSIMDASILTQKVEDPNRTSVILNISVPTLSEYQSTTTSYVFPQQITISRFDNTGSESFWNPIHIAYQDVYGTWTSDPDIFSDSVTFRYINSGTILQIVINMGSYSTSKIMFEILDNFGNTTPVIQLANEVAYDEITGSGTIHQITEADGSVTYISNDTLQFNFNSLLYNIKIFDADNSEITTLTPVPNPENNISYYTLTAEGDIYNRYYRIEVSDSKTDSPIKTLHIKLYYVLPYFTTSYNEVGNGGILFTDNRSQALDLDIDPALSTSTSTVYFDGKPYTDTTKTITTYSQSVLVRFKDGQEYANEGLYAYQDEYSYSVYLSNNNGESWTNINSSSSATVPYTINGSGNYIILIKYDSEEIFTEICQIYFINILDSESSYYYISVDGLPVDRSDMKYTDENGREYEVNYIVGVNYADKANRLSITTNKELNVRYDIFDTQTTSTDVVVEIYYYSCSAATGYFTIIYIEENNNFVSQFTYENARGADESLKSSSSAVVVANNDTESNFNRLKLEFTAYYGIRENIINIEVLKLFNGSYIEIYPTKYSDGELSYIYLDKAGSYRVRLYDSSTPANVQMFRNGEYLDIIFLNYTPFTVTYTDYQSPSIDEETQTVEYPLVVSEFIQNAVYNGSISLTMTNLSTYYQPSGYPVITVLLNGRESSEYSVRNHVYTFSQPGYYSVQFTATSTTGIPIRQQEFNFTLLNANESRYAYEFPQYQNYYIQRIVKDGEDITDSLTEISNLATITIDGKRYMSELIVNYLDEKTGNGRYTVTIATNDSTYVNTSSDTFTFSFWINRATPPINISVAEGESSTDDIVISFNVQNLYDAVGECYIQIGSSRLNINEETLASLGTSQTFTITESGTYFVQVYSTSNHLLYSYKVVKEAPLNAFAIIAIVLGVVAVAVVIGITIALRKRQKVK